MCKKILQTFICGNRATRAERYASILPYRKQRMEASRNKLCIIHFYKKGELIWHILDIDKLW